MNSQKVAFCVVASHITTGVILLIEWSQSNLSFSPLHLSPFFEWFELQKEAKFYRDSCKDIWDAENSELNSLVSDRSLKTHCFNIWVDHMNLLECILFHHMPVLCTPWLITFCEFKQVRNYRASKLGGCQEPILMVSSPDLSEWVLIISNV